ncbi:MAG TPA: glycosyltransferase family 87 protein [Terracidiphilus sp.]
MKSTRRMALLLILCSCGLSLVWGSFIVHSSSGGLTDFKAVYYGSRCLVLHADPYKNADFLRVYLADGGKIPSEPMMADLFRRAVLVCVNLPTTLFFVIPFAWLPLLPAYLLWALLMTAGLTLAGFLMWDLTADTSPRLALALICILVANCVILFADGNTACIVISLCVVSVWCFLQDRFATAGILCLALSLAIKPHDAGLVWLYFLLAGGIYRKRALQTLIVTIALCLPAMLWVSHVVPHWLPELRSNLHAAAARGGLNDPGPAAVGFHHPDPIISLQAVLSVFRDDPHIYVPASLLISAALLLLWSVTTLRLRFSPRRAWLALAAIAALTMLVTYHRQHDAKLLLLTVPACAMLWTRRGPASWFALLANSAAIVVTGDIPATGLTILTGHLPLGSGFFAHLKTAILVRPAPVILLAVAIFYLWVYIRHSGPDPADAADSKSA